MNNKSPIQEECKGPLDTGLACLVMVARMHHIVLDADQLAHEFTHSGRPFDDATLLLAAKRQKLRARRVRSQWDRLAHAPLPVIAQGQDGGYFIIARADDKQVLIHDPRQQRPEIVERAMLEERWTGTLFFIASRASLSGHLARFDFSWFLPAIVKYRHVLGEVLLASFILQLLALCSPLFFQVIVDKVLVHKGYSTLDVVAFGLVVVAIFEVVLGFLRNYLFAHTSNRIDVELGAKLFRHLLHLPQSYFAARRVGDSVARVRELENIRNFLTSSALTVVLDVFFSIVFLAVMAYYSLWLTLVVVLTLPCYVALSVLVTPVLRKRLNEKFARGAENQAFLVEAINGLETIKTLAAEPQTARTWDNQLSAYVSASFRAAHLANFASQAAGLINKLGTVVVLWLGAHFVIQGDLSVGQLIAFNMFAVRVSAPVLRLVQLWQDFQQCGVSVARLGDILNTRTEQADSASRAALPALQGRLQFEDVVFRYDPQTRPVLQALNVRIQPGEIVGIIGRSGSGKSTLAKLLQRLHVPEAGRVMVDGVDLALINPSWLRRQIGVVPQESMLFNRSIRENIAFNDPGTPLETVVRAAQLAGAHEFIVQLPQGYDTVVGEHGSSLSGGQRQRIAIARALIHNPRILIFDEATSALDIESETVIQQNMASISTGRTVLIIAHRLSALRSATRIVVVEQGRIAEDGPPQELLRNPDGFYSRLYRQQSLHPAGKIVAEVAP